jgi:hypothetical protein
MVLEDLRAVCIKMPTDLGARRTSMQTQLRKLALKDALAGSVLYEWIQQGRRARAAERSRGLPASSPRPHLAKEFHIIEIARRHGLRVFVETGTFLGDMLLTVRPHFARLFSIELDEKLHADARRRLGHRKSIELLQGDSARVLPHILERLDEPALFWLDGHYSGGITARGERDTPISEELRHVFEHRVRNHAILIDDARCFDGTADYPTLEELRAAVAKARPDFSFEVANDIIFLCPPVPAPAEETRRVADGHS